MRAKTILAVLILLSAIGARAADSSKPDPTARLRTIYDAAVEKYDTEYRGGAEAWGISYIKSLKALRASEQKSGDLDGWAAVNKELKRFQERPILPKSMVSGSKGDLHAIQAGYAKARSELEDRRHRQILDLKGKYAARLASIKAELTRAGDFEAAFKTKAEIERVNAAPEVEAAEAYLASGGEAQPETQPARAPKSPAAPAAPAKRTNAVAEGLALEDGSIIHPLGRHPQNDSSMVFKRTPLSRTSRSPLAGGITMTCWVGTEKHTTSSRTSSDYYSSSRSKSKADNRNIRLAIRSSRPGRETEALRVHVQYFSRPVAKSASHIAPSLLTEKVFEIPHLDSRALYVDLAPVTISSTQYSSSSYYGSSTSRGGSQFYGGIVTVTASGAEILFQATSASQLKEYAPTSAELVTAAKKDSAKRALEQALVAVRQRKEEFYADMANPAKKEAYREAQRLCQELSRIAEEGR